MRKHVDSLDGLRALSIAFVIYAHLSTLSQVPTAIKATSLGLEGVLIFFVLSGYLITANLLREKSETNTINLRSFIIQRAFRLLPASFALIAVSALLGKLGYVQQLSTGDILHAVTYTMDYSGPQAGTVGHLWSLSIEEQFYLLWPLALVASRRSRGIKVCAAAVLLCPLSRPVTWLFVGDSLIGHIHRFDEAADALAIGCLLALSRRRLPEWTRSNFSLALSIATIVASGFVGSRFPGFLVLQVSIDSLCAAAAINSLMRDDLAMSKMFSWRPFAWVGTVSYSLYLWQQLFTQATPEKGRFLHRFPYDLLATLTCATLSYYLLEQPIRVWARRFKPSPPPETTVGPADIAAMA